MGWLGCAVPPPHPHHYNSPSPEVPPISKWLPLSCLHCLQPPPAPPPHLLINPTARSHLLTNLTTLPTHLRCKVAEEHAMRLHVMQAVHVGVTQEHQHLLPSPQAALEVGAVPHPVDLYKRALQLNTACTCKHQLAVQVIVQDGLDALQVPGHRRLVDLCRCGSVEVWGSVGVLGSVGICWAGVSCSMCRCSGQDARKKEQRLRPSGAWRLGWEAVSSAARGRCSPTTLGKV